MLERNGWKNPVFGNLAAENEIIVRVKEFENNAQGVGATHASRIECRAS